MELKKKFIWSSIRWMKCRNWNVTWQNLLLTSLSSGWQFQFLWNYEHFWKYLIDFLTRQRWFVQYWNGRKHKSKTSYICLITEINSSLFLDRFCNKKFGIWSLFFRYDYYFTFNDSWMIVEQTPIVNRWRYCLILNQIQCPPSPLYLPVYKQHDKIYN